MSLRVVLGIYVIVTSLQQTNGQGRACPASYGVAYHPRVFVQVHSMSQVHCVVTSDRPMNTVSFRTTAGLRVCESHPGLHSVSHNLKRYKCSSNVTTSRTTVTTHSSMTLTPRDFTDGGKFVCYHYDMSCLRQAAGQTEVIVYQTPSCILISGHLEASDLTEVTIKCSMYITLRENNDVTVTWEALDVAEHRRNVTTRHVSMGYMEVQEFMTLRLDLVSHAGRKLRCRARSARGAHFPQGAPSCELQHHVQARAAVIGIDKIPEASFYYADEKVELACRAVGHPRVFYEWTDEEGIILSRNSSMVPDLSKYWPGTYKFKCEAYNWIEGSLYKDSMEVEVYTNGTHLALLVYIASGAVFLLAVVIIIVGVVCYMKKQKSRKVTRSTAYLVTAPSIRDLKEEEGARPDVEGRDQEPEGAETVPHDRTQSVPPDVSLAQQVQMQAHLAATKPNEEGDSSSDEKQQDAVED